MYGEDRGRGGQSVGLGQVDRSAGRVRRHGDVRRVRARQGRLRPLRDNCGARCRARKGDARPMSTTANVNQRLKALTEAGVSVWLDQISRSLVEGGELARLVAEDSLRGVTSNPSIFEKAILGSDDYDEQLAQLAKEGLDARTIFERMAVRDVRGATEVLADVHSAVGGRDGFVSMEVMPDLAFDTQGTLNMARGYWDAIGRPNTMIKIPGTPEGVPAIEQATCDGINVNVTLLFSVAAYERVAEDYIRG